MNLERRVCYDFRMVGPRVLLPEVTQNYDSGVSLEALNIKGLLFTSLVTVAKYLTRSNLKVREFSSVYNSRGDLVYYGGHGSRDVRGWSHSLLRQAAKSKQEVEPGYQTSELSPVTHFPQQPFNFLKGSAFSKPLTRVKCSNL